MGKKNKSISPKITVYQVNTVQYSAMRPDLDAFIMLWGNGEGIDIWLDTPKKAPAPAVKHKQTTVQLSWEQLEVLLAVAKRAWADYTGGEE